MEMSMEYSTTSGIISLVILVLSLVAEWRIFTKAGQAGWKCLIPIYNAIVELGFTWRKGKFWSILVAAVLAGFGSALLQNAGSAAAQGGTTTDIMSIAATLLALVGAIWMLVLSIKAQYYLAKSFGHGVGFTIGLLLFSPIFRLILGLGGSEYVGNGYHISKRKAA